MSRFKGGFTLPGEEGYEQLTLKLAEKWGADVIRDSDGTHLSDELTDAGFAIYSTLCVIRDHNEWAAKNMDALQQTFLVTDPVTATGQVLNIPLMDKFFAEQFRINDSERALPYWQVYDRTTDKPVPARLWQYDQAAGSVTLTGIEPFHFYTVSFLAYRIWEEISMYNHTTNHWDKEHLMQIDPRYPRTREYLLDWMEKWCVVHPATNVVRFTSMFYNFVWIWGSSERKRNLFTDWGSYDFTVSDLALEDFEKEYGYAMTAEDFIHQGKLHVTHMPPARRQKDWMEFTHRFVVSFGKQLIDIVHRYNKKAYMFYDDSWVGTEPYSEHFREFGFDGIIKCVFNGYEARLCAGVDAPVHEIRLHPYLFPVGLGGAPTFLEGGDPASDARAYWINVRRGLMRAPIQRIGLGGYLHLTEDFPDFQDYIEKISDEFRMIGQCHAAGSPYTLPLKVCVLHDWGSLRSWTLSGHFHETYMHDLIHINEALSGLPVEVSFISFEDIRDGRLDQADVIINAGRAGDAWSGGDAWKDEQIVSRLCEWVWNGGILIGVNEPSAVPGYSHYFRMAPVLGVDEDTGARICHGRWTFETEQIEDLLPEGWTIPQRGGRFLTGKDVKVLASHDGTPDLTLHSFGKGTGIYMSGFSYTPENTRMLLNLMLYASGRELNGMYLTDNAQTECSWFPDAGKMIILNQSDRVQSAAVRTETGTVRCSIDPWDQVILDME